MTCKSCCCLVLGEGNSVQLYSNYFASHTARMTLHEYKAFVTSFLQLQVSDSSSEKHNYYHHRMYTHLLNNISLLLAFKLIIIYANFCIVSSNAFEPCILIICWAPNALLGLLNQLTNWTTVCDVWNKHDIELSLVHPILIGCWQVQGDSWHLIAGWGDGNWKWCQLFRDEDKIF